MLNTLEILVELMKMFFFDISGFISEVPIDKTNIEESVEHQFNTRLELKKLRPLTYCSAVVKQNTLAYSLRKPYFY